MIEGGEVQRSVVLHAAGKIRVATRHKHQISLQRAVGSDAPRGVDAGVEAVVLAEQRQRRAFGDHLGSGAGGKQLVLVDRNQNLTRGEIVDFHSHRGMLEDRTRGDLPDLLQQGRYALGHGWHCRQQNGAQNRRRSPHSQSLQVIL